MGEKILEEKLVRKVLRALPKKFDMKATAIEEAKDIALMNVDELFGLLLTFEMSLDCKLVKKNKGIVLQFFVKEVHERIDEESKDSLADSIAPFSCLF